MKDITKPDNETQKPKNETQKPDNETKKRNNGTDLWTYLAIIGLFITLFLISLCLCFWSQIKDCLFPPKPGKESNTVTDSFESTTLQSTVKTIDSVTGKPIQSKSTQTTESLPSSEKSLKFVSYNHLFYYSSVATTSAIKTSSQTSKQLPKKEVKKDSVSKSPKTVSPNTQKPKK